MDSLELRKRFFDTAVADCLRAADGRALTGAAILAFCVIDYIAAFPRKHAEQASKIGDHYEATVEKYLGATNSKYNPKQIWQLRNSMLHVYGPSSKIHEAGLDGFVFSHRNDNYHLDRDTANRLQIDVRELVSDATVAAWKFFEDVDIDSAMWTSVEDNAKRMFVVEESGSEIKTRLYALMHPALAVFDVVPPDFRSFGLAVRGSCQSS